MTDPKNENAPLVADEQGVKEGDLERIEEKCTNKFVDSQDRFVDKLPDDTPDCLTRACPKCHNKTAEWPDCEQCGFSFQEFARIREQYADVADAMKTAKRWLVHKEKIPFYVDGRRRHGTMDTPEDMAQFATFEAAIAVLAQGRYDGLGFALGPDDTGKHWQGIDLDKLSQRPGLALLRDDMPGYTERSPSGNGWHAIGYGRPFENLGSNDRGVEAYSAGRYFTVTGDCAGVGDPCDLADFIAARVVPIHAAAAKRAPGNRATSVYVSPETITDLRSALNAIPADDRNIWIAVGAALREIGDAGRGLWLDWSQTSKKWRPKDAQTWDTLGYESTGYQAVFAKAAAMGWVNPHSALAQAPAAKAAAPKESEKAKELELPMAVIAIGDLRNASAKAPEFVLEPIIPRRHVTLLSGHGGSGKSTLALIIGAHVAAGRTFGPFATARGRVLFVSLEDEGDLVRYRLRKIVTAYELSFDDVAHNLVIVDGASVDASLAEENPYTKSLGETKAWAQLRGLVAGADLIVVDNASDGFEGNANDPRLVRTFVRRMLGRIARQNNAAVLLLTHIDKAAARNGSQGQSFIGSTAWHNSARSRLALVEKDGTLELVHEKANLSKRAEPISLYWCDAGVPMPAAQMRNDTGMGREEMIAKADDDAVLKLLEIAAKDGITVPTATSGPATAWHALSALPDIPTMYATKVGKKRLLAALVRLRRQGRVDRVSYKDRYRNEREKWVVAA